MKVLALVTDGFGSHGGIARYNAEFLTVLANTSNIERINVLARFGSNSPNLPSEINQQVIGHKFGWGANVIKQAMFKSFDMVFCGHLHLLPLAALIARVCSCKLWLQLHGIEAWQAPSKWLWRATSQADLVTCVSRYTRRRFLAWANCPPHRVKVLPNTFEPQFLPGPKSQAIIEHYGLAGAKVLLTVSRLDTTERYKGHDRVLRLLPRLIKTSVQPIRYLIVGEGEDRNRLAELARVAGVETAVIFAGRVSDKVLPDYFRTADVFVMPSTGEGFGIVFLEAASCGLPVIGGNLDGSVDALADGAIGYCLDPRDDEALLEALTTANRQIGHFTPGSVERFTFRNFAHHIKNLSDDFAAEGQPST